MIQSFIVWLLGEQLALVAMIISIIFAFFTISHKCIEGHWPWEKEE